MALVSPPLFWLSCRHAGETSHSTHKIEKVLGTQAAYLPTAEGERSRSLASASSLLRQFNLTPKVTQPAPSSLHPGAVGGSSRRTWWPGLTEPVTVSLCPGYRDGWGEAGVPLSTDDMHESVSVGMTLSSH